MKSSEIKLRVCHYPQIPCAPFIVEVATFDEAEKIKAVLADYDLFQLEKNIKGDFCNANHTEMFDPESQDWRSLEDLEDFQEQIEYLVSKGLVEAEEVAQ